MVQIILTIIKNIYFKLISHDILLLKNQIPFFVVAKIYETATGGRRGASFLVNDVVQSMKEAFDFFPKLIRESNPPKELHHLLQLFHTHFKPCQRDKHSFTTNVRSPSFHQISLRSISNLFKKSKNYFFDYDNNDIPVRETPTHWHRATEY